MFAFAARAQYRAQGHGESVRLALQAVAAQEEIMDEMATTLGARVAIVSRLLLAVARLHAADENQARALAHAVFERLTAHDPELTHFWQIVGVLRDELEARTAEANAEPPRQARLVA
jgi:hypothetical protein